MQRAGHAPATTMATNYRPQPQPTDTTQHAPTRQVVQSASLQQRRATNNRRQV
ncbi:hypothetical protein [Bradyrhizobium sp. USDA 4508]